MPSPTLFCRFRRQKTDPIRPEAWTATDTPTAPAPSPPRSGHGVGYDLTLIEAEVLDELTLPDGQRLGYEEARRNIVTRGIDLNTLVGQRFRIGDVECVGRRLCPST